MPLRGYIRYAQLQTHFSEHQKARKTSRPSIINETEKMAIKPISVKPIAVPEGSGINFGAQISNVDIENLTGR